ncbi:uncharacterized protein LOC144221326 [Crocuta crocuta]
MKRSDLGPPASGQSSLEVQYGQGLVLEVSLYSSRALRTFTLLCGHHHHPCPELLHHPRLKLHSHGTATSHFSLPRPLQTVLLLNHCLHKLQAGHSSCPTAAYCPELSLLVLQCLPSVLFLLEIHLALSTKEKEKGNYTPELSKPIKWQRFLKKTALNPKALAACAVMKCMTTGDNNNCSNGSLQLPDDLGLSGVRCPLTSQEANGISDCRP